MRGACRFSTWLYAILLHRHQKQLRREAARLPSLASFHRVDVEEREDALSRVPAPERLASEETIRRETAGRLRVAIATLPATQAVVRLRFFDGSALQEIAAALDIPLGTVKSRLHHALETLRTSQQVVNLFDGARDRQV